MTTPRIEPMPREFAAALKKNPRAQAAFEKMPPSHKREYLKHINEAKRPETTLRRVENSIARLEKPAAPKAGAGE